MTNTIMCEGLDNIATPLHPPNPTSIILIRHFHRTSTPYQQYLTWWNTLPSPPPWTEDSAWGNPRLIVIWLLYRLLSCVFPQENTWRFVYTYSVVRCCSTALVSLLVRIKSNGYGNFLDCGGGKVIVCLCAVAYFIIFGAADEDVDYVCVMMVYVWVFMVGFWCWCWMIRKKTQ